MTDQGPPAPTRRPFSEPVRAMVANASDEQLAWMVGPDRDFYSREAIQAASEELERRRAAQGERPEPPRFEPAAFAFGPLWYFYHGMIGRGVMILFVLLGALFGLQPIAEALELPDAIWLLLVLLGVGAYSGRYGARDLAESQHQARLAAQKIPTPRETPDPGTKAAKLTKVAQVGCPQAAQRVRALLEPQGLRAHLLTVEGGPEVAVLVDVDSAKRARELLVGLLAELSADDEVCSEADPSGSS